MHVILVIPVMATPVIMMMLMNAQMGLTTVMHMPYVQILKLDLIANAAVDGRAMVSHVPSHM